MTRKVYRLEDVQGNGPYFGDQPCVPYLIPHTDPDVLLWSLGYPKLKLHNILDRYNFVYGWRTLNHYRKYFKPGGIAACEKLGFIMTIYEPEWRLDLPDGQVLFSKTIDPSIGSCIVKDLLGALSKPSRE